MERLWELWYVKRNLRKVKNKLSIALKEANETDYWLKLLHDSEIIKAEVYNPLCDGILELIKILVASIKTSKSKLK